MVDSSARAAAALLSSFCWADEKNEKNESSSNDDTIARTNIWLLIFSFEVVLSQQNERRGMREN
jgi:hypothetical protein